MDTFRKLSFYRQLPPEDESETMSADDLAIIDELPNSEMDLPNLAGQHDSFQSNTNFTGAMHSNNIGSRNQNQRREPRNSRSSNESRGSNCRIQTTLPFSRQQNAIPSRNDDIPDMDNLDAFDEDDEFERSLDYGAIDEIEKESLNKSSVSLNLASFYKAVLRIDICLFLFSPILVLALM